MIDLTKIDQPFGTLPKATKMALFEAWMDGADIEYLITSGWFVATNPTFWSQTTFRVRPAPVTYDTIDWGDVVPRFIAMARDEDGRVYLYDTAPKSDAAYWYSANGSNRWADHFASYTRGTCDWRNSLVLRPKVGV